MRNGVTAESRYSKDQLLGIYQDQKASGGLSKNLAHLFSGSWDPLSSRNGESSPWSKHEGKESSTGPEVCWDHEASGNPLGLIEMSEEEKNVSIDRNFWVYKAATNAGLVVLIIRQLTTETAAG